MSAKRGAEPVSAAERAAADQRAAVDWVAHERIHAVPVRSAFAQVGAGNGVQVVLEREHAADDEEERGGQRGAPATSSSSRAPGSASARR